MISLIYSAKRTMLLSFLLFISIAHVVGQEGSWHIGKYEAHIRKATIPPPALKAKMIEGISIGTITAGSAVGGVAFLAVASPDSGMEKKIRVDYIKTNSD